MTKYSSGLPPTPAERSEKIAETVGGWLVLILCGVGVLLWWDGKFSGLLSSDNLLNSHALEVRCVADTRLDNNKLCLEPERIGAELEFRVNTTTGNVMMTVVKNDGNWFFKEKILDHCSVVDTSNWRCRDEVGKLDNPIFFVNETGMSHGRYYSSVTGGSGADYYTSSISGPTFRALHDQSISVQTAMERTGYSQKALSTFVDPELERLQKEKEQLQQEKARDARIDPQAQSELDRRNRCEAERALGRKC